MIRALGLALVATLAFTSIAQAQTAQTPLATLTPPRLNLKPVDPGTLRYAQAPTPLPRGVARTSIERREGAVTGSAGLLCGLQPSADRSGVGSARGYNTEGRFIGAKLGFTF